MKTKVAGDMEKKCGSCEKKTIKKNLLLKNYSNLNVLLNFDEDYRFKLC